MLLAKVSTPDLVVFILVLLGVLIALGWVSWLGWRMTWSKVALSPYSGLPLRYGRDIGYYKAEEIYRFLYNKKQYDNRMFDLRKASFCRETGRIFPDSVSFLDTIDVDWTFLQKRFKGDYVSWGSLSHQQQEAIRKQHESLSAFQTDISSPNPLPRMIETDFAFTQPGPLYVDISTGTLLGWQSVPGTEFEVLIVQKPTKIILQQPT